MSRSVSTHQHAVATAYLHPFQPEFDDREFEWKSFVEDLVDVLHTKYPSLRPCARWQGRENKVVLENQVFEVSVSEYYGLVAICLAPLDPDIGFSLAATERLKLGFIKHIHKNYKSCALFLLGHASNGEGVFRTIQS